MGDVVPLKRTCCPCGWPTPQNLSVELEAPMLAPPVSGAVVRFTCPECGRVLQMGKSTQERTTS